MAEVLAADRLGRRIPDLAVASAGLVLEGRPAEPGAVRAMARRGLDLTGHVARRLTPAVAAGADLVLGMEPRHVRAAVVDGGVPLERAWTLLGLVARGRRLGGRRADEPLGAWLARVGEGRQPTDLLGDDPAESVPDPMGGTDRDFEEVAATIAAAVDELADLLAGPTGRPPVRW